MDVKEKRCKLCNDFVVDLVHHKKMRHKIDYTCTLCNETFGPHYVNWKHHVNAIHPESKHILRFRCKYCTDYIIGCKKNYLRHIQEYHNVIFDCVYCGKKFMNPVYSKHLLHCYRIIFPKQLV